MAGDNILLEETVKMPRGMGNYNLFHNMIVVKSDTEEGLIEEVKKIDSPVIIKAMYYSPTSNKHVAYLLTNKKI